MTPHEIWTNLIKRKIHVGVLLVLLFLPLFFYLYFEKPELPLFILGLFIFWGISLYLDMRITLSLKGKIGKHESNDIFRVLYKRLGKRAIIIQLGIEFTFVVLFPSIATLRQPGETFEIDVMGAAILAGIIGVLHIFAWRNNKKEIQKIHDKKYV